MATREMWMPPASRVHRARTKGMMGYAVEWSPFAPRRLAASCSQHYGIIGNGRLAVFDASPDGLVQVASFDTRHGLYSCSWSEAHEVQLVTGGSDGALKLWKVDMPAGSPPLRSFEEHVKEVHDVQWDPVGKRRFVSGSWDHTIKIWDPERPMSLATLMGHDNCIYSTRWSPHDADVIASTSGDCTLRLWSANQPGPMMSIKAHGYEILSCDWCKYRPHTIATASIDRTIRVWDIRMQRVLVQLSGHEYAVRRVKFSPHDATIIASASYDMTVRLWDFANGGSQIERFDHHTEFVVGLDFNLFVPGQLASCSWDESIATFGTPSQAFP